MSPNKQISSKVSFLSSFFTKSCFFDFFLILSQVLRCETQICIFWKILFTKDMNIQISKKLEKTVFLWQILGGFNELYFLKKNSDKAILLWKKSSKYQVFCVFLHFSRSATDNGCQYFRKNKIFGVLRTKKSWFWGFATDYRHKKYVNLNFSCIWIHFTNRNTAIWSRGNGNLDDNALYSLLNCLSRHGGQTIDLASYEAQHDPGSP